MSVSPSSTAPPASPIDQGFSRALWSSPSPAEASPAPSSTAPEPADSPAGRSLEDGIRSPTAGSASSPHLYGSPGSRASPPGESVCSCAGAAASSDALEAHDSDHRPSASSSAPPALEPSVLVDPFSCRDGSGAIKQGVRELLQDLIRCGFLVPLPSPLEPWPQPEDTSSPGAYLTFNAVDSHVRASVGESADQAFAAIWSLREVKLAQPVCGMEPLIEQLLWLCLGWCHGDHHSRTKAAVHCLWDVLHEVEPGLRLHEIKSCKTVARSLILCHCVTMALAR